MARVFIGSMKKQAVLTAPGNLYNLKSQLQDKADPVDTKGKDRRNLAIS